jgi:hypothetical protein
MSYPSGSNDPEPMVKISGASATADLSALEEQALLYRRHLVEKGAFIPAEEMKERVANTRHSAPDADLESMFTVELDGRLYYPAFFLAPDISRQVLAEITVLLAPLPGWSKWYFFTTRNAALGAESPLDALRHGQMERVRRAAATYTER